MLGGVGHGAPIFKGGDETHTVGAGFGECVLGVALGGGAAVAEVPVEGGATAGIGETDSIRSAANRGIEEVGYWKVVVDVDAEESIVAVGAVVMLRPCTGSGGELVVAVAAGADALVEGGHLVESAGASVDMVVASAGVAAVQLAKECGIVELRGIGGDAHDVEVLPVGGGLDGVGCGLHAGGAVLVPIVS